MVFLLGDIAYACSVVIAERMWCVYVYLWYMIYEFIDNNCIILVYEYMGGESGDLGSFLLDIIQIYI